MWQIPLLSKFTYHEPQPIHTVTLVAENSKDLANRIVKFVGQREVVLKESELTMLANQGALNSRLGISDITVAADSVQKNLEMSFRIPKKRNALVRLRLNPKITSDGKLTFEPQKTLIGETSLPNWLIGEPIRFVLAIELQPILKPLPKLQEVKIENAGLRLTW
jgi:hypothetical protein